MKPVQEKCIQTLVEGRKADFIQGAFARTSCGRRETGLNSQFHKDRLGFAMLEQGGIPGWKTNMRKHQG